MNDMAKKQIAIATLPFKKTVSLFLLLTFFLFTVAPPNVFAHEDPTVLAGEPVEVEHVDDATHIVTTHSEETHLAWDSFSGSFQFIQPTVDSWTLNFVVGQAVSQLGNITSNGGVGIFNPNGIEFIAGARVDVASLLASTLAFQSNSIFDSALTFAKQAGSNPGAILNQADIQVADGGYVALLAEQIKNMGTITANLGSIALGVGERATVSFDQQGLINLVVDQGLVDMIQKDQPAILNTGDVIANSGKIVFTAKTLNDTLDTIINNEGLVQAYGAVNHDGVIEFVSNGANINPGVIRAEVFDEKGYTWRTTGGMHGGIAYYDNIDGAANISGNISSDQSDTGDLIVTGNVVLVDPDDFTDLFAVTFTADSDANGTGQFSMNTGTTITDSTRMGSDLTINTGASGNLGAITVVNNLTFGRQGTATPTYTATGNLAWDSAGMGTTLTVNAGTTLAMGTKNISGGGTASALSNAGTITNTTGTITADGGGTNSGTMTASGTGAWSLGADGGAAFTNSGTMTQSTNTATFGGGLTNSGTYNGSGSTVSIGGMGGSLANSGTFSAGTGTVTITTLTNTGTFNASSGSVNINGDFNNTSGTFNESTGTVVLQSGSGGGNTTFTTGNDSFNNITINHSGDGSADSDRVIISGTLDVNGTLTVTTGTLDFNGQTIDLASAIVNNAIVRFRNTETLTNYTADTNSGTVEYYTTAAATSGALKGGATYYNLLFTMDTNTDVWTLGTNTTVNNALSVDTGILSLAGKNISMASQTSLDTELGANAGTVRLQGTETVSITSGGAQQTWEYVGDGAGGTTSFTVQDFGATDYAALKINATDGTETYTLGGALVTSGALTISSGTLAAATNNITAKSIANSATLTVSTGTLTFTEGGSNSGTITGTGTGTWNLSNLDADTNLTTFTNTGTITADSHTINVDANLDFSTGTFNAGSSTLVFKGGVDQTFTTGSEVINNLTINNSGSAGFRGDNVIVSGALDVNGTLTLTDGDLDVNTNDPAINTSGTITVGANGTIDRGAGVWTIDGSGTTTFTDNTTSGLNYGAITVDGTSKTLSLAGSSTGRTFSTVTIGADDTFSMNGENVTITTLVNNGTFQLQGGETATITTFDTNSGTTVYNGTSSYNSLAAGDAYWDLTFNGSGGVWNLDAALAVSGDLTITAGTLDLNGSNLTHAALKTFSNSGTLRLQGGETLTNFTNDVDSGTVEYDGDGTVAATTQTIKQFNVGGGSVDYYNLIINDTSASNKDTFQLGAALVVDGNLTISSSTLDLNGSNLTLAVGSTFSNSDTLKLQGAETLTNFTNDTNSGTILYAGDGVTNYTSLVAGNTYNNVTFNNAGNSWTLGAALDVNQNLTITAGTLDVKTGSDFGVTVGGNWSNSGTFTARAGTVTFDATDTDNTINAGPSSFYGVTFNGSGGAWDLATNNMDIDNALTITNGTFDLNGKNLTMTGAAFSNAGTLRLQGGETLTNFANDTDSGTVTYDGTTTYTGLAAGNNYYNLTFNGSGGAWNLNAALDVNSTLTITDGTLDLSGSNLDLTGGTFSNSSILQLKGGETLTAFTNDTDSGTVVYDGDGATTYSSLAAGNNYNSVTFNNAGNTWTLGAAMDVNSNLTITTGTLDVSGTNYGVTVGGNWSNAGTFTERSGTVTFDKANGTQTLNNGSDDLNNLSHTGAGTLQLATNGLTVNGTFTNSAGTFDANALANTVTGLTTVSGGTYSASTATQTLGGGLTVSGGTFTGSSGTVDVNGTMTLSSGTLTAPTGTFRISGDWTVEGGTFTPGSGTVTLDGTADQTLTAGGKSFNNLTINNTGAAGSDDILAADALDVDGSFTITDGDFNAPQSANFSIAKNFTMQAAGSFQARSGTVIFDTTNTSTITIVGGGDITFATFRSDNITNTDNSEGKTIYFNSAGGGEFESYGLFTFGTFTIKGGIDGDGEHVTLSTTNAEWDMSATTVNISDASVADSNNRGSSINCITCTDLDMNGGHGNSGWTFGTSTTAQEAAAQAAEEAYYAQLYQSESYYSGESYSDYGYEYGTTESSYGESTQTETKPAAQEKTAAKDEKKTEAGEKKTGASGGQKTTEAAAADSRVDASALSQVSARANLSAIGLDPYGAGAFTLGQILVSSIYVEEGTVRVTPREWKA